MPVSPSDTTDYTITATGPGGTSDPASVTVTVYQKPTVTLQADRTSINKGETVTLSWNTTGIVDTCVLQPDNDSVDPANGSIQKTPRMNTTYTITAAGPGGTESSAVSVMVTAHLVITSPLEGSHIERPDTLVQGTIDRDAFTGDDIGVVVNGVVAHVYNGVFAANHVPLRNGDNSTITAYAFNDSGDNATDSVSVIADTTSNYLTLSSNPESGIVSGTAPLDFTLSLAKTYSSQGYSFSYDPDNGSIENRGDNETTMKFERRVAEPGLYFITVDDNETLDNGTRVLRTDNIAIMADNRTAFDTKLRVKWGAMKEALSSLNTANALKFISNASKETYNQVYSDLSAQLPGIIANMQDIQLIYVQDRLAKYRIRRVHNIDGQNVTLTYYIYFVKDTDGTWKIDTW